MYSNVLYPDVIEDKPILLSQKDVPLKEIKFAHSKGVIIDDVNVVSLYKKKYNLDEIKQNQVVIFAILQNMICDIKNILVVLTDGKVQIDTEENEVNNVIQKEIIDFDFDFDAFFDNTGIKLSNYYNSSSFDDLINLDNINNLDKTVIAKKMLYITIAELGWVRDNNGQVNLRNVDIYLLFNQFLDVFNLFLQIKTKLSFFFSLLLDNKEVSDKGINLFFLQFEYLVLFDLFHHTSGRLLYKFIKEYGPNLVKENYARYCVDFSSRLFSIFFSGISLFKVESFISLRLGLYLSLEYSFFLHLNEKKDISSFCTLLSEKIKDSSFVIKEEGTFAYLYDDCIIDFDYIICMLHSLRYTYFMPPYFLSSFLHKHV